MWEIGFMGTCFIYVHFMGIKSQQIYVDRKSNRKMLDGWMGLYEHTLW